MKKLYILALLATIGFSSNAQNFVYSTDQHIEGTLQYAFDIFDINFTTASPMEVTFGWQTISNTMPSGWDFSVCDYTNCYVGVPSSGTMVTITLPLATSGTEGFIKLTAGHSGINGDGTIEMYVFDVNDPANGDTISFHLTYASAGVDELANASITMYPNPASDIVNFEGDAFTSVAVYNTLGEQVVSIVGDLTNSIDVSKLTSGVYIVSLENEAGSTFTKRLIVQ
ncbi:MAG: hypothetical protein ACI837_000246 [Crocinitomicaceae bacterium]|jgi:hypothetical protein